MHPVLFKIGSFTLYSYGLMVALAFICGTLLSVALAKRAGIKPEKIIDLALVVILSSIIGARSFYVMEFWTEFAQNPWAAIQVWNGGLVFYGGLLFSVIAVVIYCRREGILEWKMLDILAPGTALGYAIGRIGCFLRGCCYGVETTLPWAVKFPESCGLRHPTQIYAFFAGILIMAILLFILKWKKFDGQVVLSGIVLYAIYRFTIEFIRINPRYYLGLSEAQWGSVVILIIGAALYSILHPPTTGRPRCRP